MSGGGGKVEGHDEEEEITRWRKRRKRKVGVVALTRPFPFYLMSGPCLQCLKNKLACCTFALHI